MCRSCCFFRLYLFFLHFFFFFFNATPTTEIYTLSLHDALPICPLGDVLNPCGQIVDMLRKPYRTKFRLIPGDRKSTRLNSSHVSISYAVFCLKKKRKRV